MVEQHAQVGTKTRNLTYWRSLLFCLSHGPYILNARGIGFMIADKQPRNVQAHFTPIVSNIYLKKGGNLAATDE